MAETEGYEIEERGEFIIFKNRIKRNNGRRKVFVLKGYNDVKGGYYEEIEDQLKQN